MKKRILALALVIIMPLALSLLTACGGNSNTPSGRSYTSSGEYNAPFGSDSTSSPPSTTPVSEPEQTEHVKELVPVLGLTPDEIIQLLGQPYRENFIDNTNPFMFQYDEVLTNLLFVDGRVSSATLLPGSSYTVFGVYVGADVNKAIDHLEGLGCSYEYTTDDSEELMGLTNAQGVVLYARLSDTEMVGITLVVENSDTEIVMIRALFQTFSE